jgi:5-methylcytosine-specific restriction endonuclease McrA
MSKRQYTNEQVIEAAKNSTSIRQVLSKLGLKEAGGNYRCIKNLMKKLNIDTSHFLGKRNNLGKKFGPKRATEEYLNNEASINSYKLKKRLISEGYFEHKCHRCNKTEWFGEKIPLELHHKNDSNDNSLENLELLCPNCHALTPNYRAKKPPK